MKKYYIYAHSKPNGEVFYVGKGSGNRLNRTGNRSLFWKNYSKKHGFVASILFDGLTEDEAYDKEIETIAFYKAKGFCAVNVSLGGDGVKVKSRWWGKAISEALLGGSGPKGRDNKNYKDVISKSQLQELYVDKGLPTPKIAEMFGVSVPTICGRLAAYGFQIRNPGRKQIGIMCLDDGLKFGSVNDPARYYGVFRESIRKVLKGLYRHTGKRRFAYAEK